MRGRVWPFAADRAGPSQYPGSELFAHARTRRRRRRPSRRARRVLPSASARCSRPVECAAGNCAHSLRVSVRNTYRGLRVLDLGTNIAAPFAAMMLGDMGADVIKIERPPSGDDPRALPPHWGHDATVFLAVNRNKRSVLLDIKTPEGRAALFKLVESADVVVESFPPGLAEKLKLRFEDLHAHNPRTVLCSVSAFGDGPLGAQMPGYDALVQAVSGLMSFTGQPEAPPIRLAPSVLDLTAGMWGLIGIMAALTRLAAGGGGEAVRPAVHEL